ncbi:MAG TPA: TonB-dependent receptor plug domain-containing protein [Opitutaceae bacterium]|nr:TonB-dependent receptor plug domain-containing protein [Opitutaceae bacterium]
MKRGYVLSSLLAAAAFAPVRAQTSPTPESSAPMADEAVHLPAFEIKSEKDTEYVGKSSLSTTRIAVELSELPQSVKVLNNSFLKAVNPFNLSDILYYTGGAQNGGLNWTPGRLNIRGFSGDGDYNDGFAPGAGSVVDSSLYDRFEVIKGPSTIFLAADGSPGGVVNKITKSPLSVPMSTITVQTGLYDGNHVDIDTTGPVTADGKLLYRLVAAEQYSKGYYDGTYMHRFTIMPALSYQFAPATKLEVKALLVETNWPSYNGLPIDPSTHQMYNVPYTRSQSENAPYNWRHDAVKRLWFNFQSRLTDFAAFRLGGMTSSDRADRLESLAATWNEGSRTFVTLNPDGSVPRTTTADDAHGVYRDLQSDVNFNFTTGPVSHNLLVGGEYRDSPGFTVTYPGTSSPWNPFVKTAPMVTEDYSTIKAQTSSTGTNLRGFALETMKLFNDKLLLSYGVSRARGEASTLNQLANAYSTPKYTLFKNLKQWGIVYKALPGVSLFTGYNENFALNGTGIVNGVSGPLPPKQGRQYEVGVKSELLNKRLGVNVSYFDIQQTNNTVPSAPLDPLNPNVLIPGVISRGFDGDASLQVNRNIYLVGSFAVYNPKSILGPAAANFVQPYYGRIVTGSIPVANTAKQTASLFGVYNFNNGTFKGLSVGIGANYQSKRAITDGPNQVMWGYVPERTIVNSNINYIQNKHWKYSMNIDNVLDKKYIYSVRSENVIVPGQAINLKFSVSYSL